MSRAARFGNLGDARAYRKATGWQKGTCTWCHKVLPSPRMTWCRDEDPATGFNPCLAEFFARQHYPSARPHVWIRDRGHCRGCGRDLRWQATQWRPNWCRPEVAGPTAEEKWEIWRLRAGRGPERWECDHIIPVAEGGGDLGFANLQVMCVPCHKDKTAEQAARAAAARRPPEPPPRGEQQVLFGRCA